MANPDPIRDSDVPREFANVTPDMSAGIGQLRIVVKTLEEHIREIKDDMKEIKRHRHSDFVLTITISRWLSITGRNAHIWLFPS